MIYVLVKILVLNDYFCYDAMKFNKRLLAPHTPTWGALTPEIAVGADTLFAAFCLFVISCFCWHLYVSLLSKLNTNMTFTYMDLIFAPVLVITYFWTFVFSFTLPPYCYSLSFLLLLISTVLVLLFLPTFLNTRREVPVSAAPILECAPVVNTSITADTTLKFLLKSRVNTAMLSAAGVPIEGTAFVQDAPGSFVNDYDFVVALIEQDSFASLRYGMLFLLALSSLGVYSIILAGWSSNSKYAFIGALRSAAQMISYEVAISLIILPVVVFCGSLDLSMITYVQHITGWLCWPLLPITLLFLIAMLAETNRTPFDLPEAEAELVAGYNVDYSSLPFAMFFLGEYCNMILISTLFCILFLAGGLNSLHIASSIVLSAKAAVAWVFFVLVRATLPRYRYDQLMDIGWKVFLPTAGSFLPLVFGILVVFHALPVSNELPRYNWVL